MKKYHFVSLFVLVFLLAIIILPSKASAKFYCCNVDYGGFMGGSLVSCGGGISGSCDNYGKDSAGNNVSGWTYCGLKGKSACVNARVQYPNGPQSLSDLMTIFYDENLNIAHPWMQTGDMTTGASGVAFDYLVQRLIDYGFITSDQFAEFDSSGAPKTYNSLVTLAVTDLQKALRLNKTNGVFNVATRDAFGKFILDLLAADYSSGEKISNFAIIWPDGRLQTFNSDQRIAFSVSTITYDSVPAPSSVPIFIRKDTDGKVYQWNSSTKKWDLSIYVFSSDTSGSADTISIKNLLSSFSVELSDIVSSFSPSSSVRTSDPSLNILSKFGFNDISVFEKFFGTTNDNTFNTPDSTILTTFSQKFSTAISKLPSNTQDIYIYSSSINSTIGFDPNTGVFSTKMCCPSGHTGICTTRCGQTF